MTTVHSLQVAWFILTLYGVAGATIVTKSMKAVTAALKEATEVRDRTKQEAKKLLAEIAANIMAVEATKSSKPTTAGFLN